MRKYNLTEAFEELDKIYDEPLKTFRITVDVGDYDYDDDDNRWYWHSDYKDFIVKAPSESEIEDALFAAYPECAEASERIDQREGDGAFFDHIDIDEIDDNGNIVTEAFDEEEVEIVKEPIEEPEVNEPSCVEKTANEVMAAYQNANKWLDSVKEAIYTKMSCPVLSNYIHQLAHKMPQEFDDFGSILHTVNMEIPYPATAEISKKPETIVEAIEMTLSFLDDIKVALNAFITCTDNEYHGMSCAAESCLNKIEEEYPMLYRLLDNAKKYIDDTVSFEKYVLALVEHKDELLD